jgi:hypothetical protein
MPPTHDYKLIIGSVKHPINDQLRTEGHQGWKPILMSTPLDRDGTPQVYIVLEHVRGS